jgi:sodium-independent sulfate anion transporter 11
VHILAEGKPIDTDQELLGIGMTNFGNSFSHGFTGAGAIARGALNYSSGVRSPLGGLYTGTFFFNDQFMLKYVVIPPHVCQKIVMEFKV